MYLLTVLAAIALWFLSAFVFVPLGKFLYRIWKDVMDEMDRDDGRSDDSRRGRN